MTDPGRFWRRLARWLAFAMLCLELTLLGISGDPKDWLVLFHLASGKESPELQSKFSNCMTTLFACFGCSFCPWGTNVIILFFICGPTGGGGRTINTTRRILTLTLFIFTVLPPYFFTSIHLAKSKSQELHFLGFSALSLYLLCAGLLLASGIRAWKESISIHLRLLGQFRVIRQPNDSALTPSLLPIKFVAAFQQLNFSVQILQVIA